MTDSLINMLQVYKQQIENDFQSEWSKQHFKWFFKKRRRKKLRNKIFRRYQMGIFNLAGDYIENMLPKAIEESMENLTNIKDVTFGDKAYFTEENPND